MVVRQSGFKFRADDDKFFISRSSDENVAGFGVEEAKPVKSERLSKGSEDISQSEIIAFMGEQDLVRDDEFEVVLVKVPREVFYFEKDSKDIFSLFERGIIVGEICREMTV
jgi:hypothetical protein